MASERQIAANRRNAQKCTGPNTEAGKRASRMNALKHGMTARTIVLPYEDEIEYHETRAALIEGYQPASNAELMLVDQIAAGYWRTSRARAYERAMLTGHINSRKAENGLKPVPDGEHDDLASAVVLAKEPKEAFDNYFRYDASIERALYRAINALEKLQSRRTRDERLAAPRVPKMGLVSIRSGENPAEPRIPGLIKPALLALIACILMLLPAAKAATPKTFRPPVTLVTTPARPVIYDLRITSCTGSRSRMSSTGDSKSSVSTHARPTPTRVGISER
jgi:hypothetical protein